MLYKVGTRGSKLALKQTEQVIETLRAAFLEDEFEIVAIETTGDKQRDKPIESIGSKGVFVDTIEKDLLSGEISLAVHSMKDMPAEPKRGLVFTKPIGREDPRDVLILREAGCLSDVRERGRIGTGSKRRGFQLLKLRPDLEIVPIRGNIDTRLRRLFEPGPGMESLDGIVIAAAGMKRLGREGEITQFFDVDEMIPAPAQGILALEVRGDNLELIDKINSLSDADTEIAEYIERGFLLKTGAGCHDPIGAYACREGDDWVLRALYGRSDGSGLKSVCIRGSDADQMIAEAVMALKGV